MAVDFKLNENFAQNDVIADHFMKEISYGEKVGSNEIDNVHSDGSNLFDPGTNLLTGTEIDFADLLKNNQHFLSSDPLSGNYENFIDENSRQRGVSNVDLSSFDNRGRRRVKKKKKRRTKAAIRRLQRKKQKKPRTILAVSENERPKFLETLEPSSGDPNLFSLKDVPDNIIYPAMLKDEENYPIQDLQMVTSDQLNTDLDSDPVLVPPVLPNSISNDDDYFPSP